MLRIALCDDDPCVCTVLRSFLAQYQILHDTEEPFEFEFRYFGTSKELLETDFPYEVLFLDILLEDGKNGIEIGKILRKNRNSAYIILLTSLTTEVMRGYSAKVLRYLLKPVKYDDIAEALDFIRFEMSTEVSQIMVTFRRVARMINVADIQCIQTYYRQTELVTKDEHIRCSETLEELEPRLPVGFCRTSRSFIVNFKYVKELSRLGIRTTGGLFIPFQRGNSEKYDEVNRLFNKYVLEEKEYV